jgi:DNA polymerase III epsilon subunit family exonuclease
MALINEITVFDFETSGLDPQKDRVIEMAAIRIANGQIVGEFSTLVQFNGALTPKIKELTGIQDEALKHGFDEVTAFKIFNRFIGNSVIVAHNAAFDLGFLHHSLMRLAKRSFNNSFIDTLTISRDRTFFPYKLIDLCGRYNIELLGAHRALSDVYGCWHLYEAFGKEVKINDYLNKLGYMSKYGPPKWAPDYAVLQAQENRYEERQ